MTCLVAKAGASAGLDTVGYSASTVCLTMAWVAATVSLCVLEGLQSATEILCRRVSLSKTSLSSATGLLCMSTGLSFVTAAQPRLS